jgi:peptide/nickel transport system substrate-binding protein
VLRQLRWQIGLALAGVLIIGALLALFSNRAFEDRPARGGQLVEALVGRPAVLNPLFAVEDSEKTITRLVFCALTRPDPLLGPRADLATNWTISPDGLEYTFHLREDALWHDGQPVTADDVVFTADMARRVADDPALSVSASPLVRPWANVTATALDEHTVRLTLDEPYAPFMDATALGILPAHILVGITPDELPKHRLSQVEPVGCGPYRVDVPGGIDTERARLVRHDEHWDTGGADGSRQTDRPYLDALEFRFTASREEAVAAVGQQEVQTMGGVPADAFDELGDDARLFSATESGYTLVYINHDNVLFSDPVVRQALSLGLDRAGIVHDPTLVNGQGQVAASPIAPGSWAHDPSIPAPTFDPEQARGVLEDAGWTDGDGDGVRDREGKRLSFSLGTLDDPLNMAIAQRIADDWSKIGAEVLIEPHNQQGAVHALSNRDYEAMLFSWKLQSYEPDPYPLWHSTQVDGGQNFAGYSNPEMDQVLVELRRAHPEDRAGRFELFSEFQRMFAEDLPALLIYHPVYTYAVGDPNLGGVQLPQLIVDPSDRFTTLPDWFVRTERVFGESGPSGADEGEGGS